MEFKSMVNKESFKSILHHHLKNQIRIKFRNTILQDLHKLTESEPILSEDVIDCVGHAISQSDESKEFLKTFLNSINILFEDKEKYIPKEENQGSVSQCSSASSISTSIDYVSFDQFQDIINTLSNGVNAEKLEALETFSRLPSLEHITKRTLWPAVENGLHDALLSNVSFLKDASLHIYTKMLSSSEPKVVQESFNSLIKHLIHNLLPSIDQNCDDFISKCKLVVEIIAMLNRFLQNIPNHWLRYPQPIIEDITRQSISILSYGSRNSNVFPVWLCIALCDKKTKWFKALLYGQVSRGFLLDALQKDPEILKVIIRISENFKPEDDWNNEKCCQRFADVSEITHVICFLSYLLQYSQCRAVFKSIYGEEPFPWLNVFNLVMNCSQKLCSVSCLKCCSTVFDEVPKIWHNMWSCDNTTVCCDALIKILHCFNDIQNLSTNNLIFVIHCLSHSFNNFINTDNNEDAWEMYVNYMCTLYKHLTNLHYNFPDETPPEILKLVNSSLTLTNKILSSPSNLFINFTFLKIFSLWCSKVNSISKILATSYSPGTKSNLIRETERNNYCMFISMLQKPSGIMISQDLGLFDTSFNILLENMLQDIKVKNSVSPRDVCILSAALKSDYLSKSVLNKSILFKISSVLWLLETGESENFEKIRNLLDVLVPSVFPDVFENEIFDNQYDNDETFFHCLTLCPSVIKEDFVMLEEYNMLALQVLSTLSCSILSSCYLQANFKLSDKLFDFQSHHYDVKDKPIIDPVSVIQNHLLVKLYVVGGSEEKILPPATLLENNEDYNFPFFNNYPVPHVYYQEVTGVVSDTDITFELNGENLKDIFLEYVEDDLLSVDVIAQILKASINILEPVLSLSRTLNCVNLEDIDDIVLQEEIIYGFEMVNRYGKMLNLVAYEDEKILERLLKAGKVLFSSEKRFQLDIFICTLCLIFRCDIQTAWIFLETFAKSSCSLFIWYERIFQAITLNKTFIPTFNVIMEYCDIIVKKTLPLVYSALQFSGILPSSLFKYWTTHCYWNYLNFTEIAQFVLISVIFGGDYAIYFFVSVLKHLQSTILKNAHSSNLMNVIKQNPIKGYKIKNFMSFIIELANVFQSKISKSIANTLEE